MTTICPGTESQTKLVTTMGPGKEGTISLMIICLTEEDAPGKGQISYKLGGCVVCALWWESLMLLSYEGADREKPIQDILDGPYSTAHKSSLKDSLLSDKSGSQDRSWDNISDWLMLILNTVFYV